LAGLALASRPVFWIAMRGRVDGLAAALALGGFLCGLYGRGRASGLAAALLLAGATLTKTSMVAAPLALAAAMWTTRRRRGLAIAGLWLALVAGTLAWLQVATHGAYLGALHRPLSHLLRPFEMAFRTVTTTAPWLGWTLLVWLGLTREQRRACYPWCWYAWLALVVGCASSAAQGASWNYLFEFYLALALCACRLWATRPAPDRAWWLVLQVVGSTVYLAVAVTPASEARTQAHLHEAAVARLRPRLNAGQRVAVFGNHGAEEALLDLGAPNGLDIIDGLALNRAEVDRLAAQALASGRLDVVLEGPALTPWQLAAPHSARVTR